MGRLCERAAELSISDRARAEIPGDKVGAFRGGGAQRSSIEKLARKVTVSASAELDALYPQLRPARVTLITDRGVFTRQADEALGSRILPLHDEALETKFLGLVAPVLGETRAHELAARLRSIEDLDDSAPLIEAMAKPA
jgi:2-methylcitrate dehydratase PrpD